MFSAPYHVRECTSTMELADRLLESGELGFGGVVVTDHQTLGQGTHGRSWEDTPGASLLATLVLAPGQVDGLLPLRIGLAVIDMLVAQGLDSLELKWPNDCLCDERKIAGVLCRANPQRALVGIGINVRDHPDDGASTSLSARLPASAVCPAPHELLSPLLAACDDRLRSTDIREACERYLWGLGRDVSLSPPGGRTMRGRLEGLTDDGGLVLEGHGPVYAGRLRL